jgi:Putative peptidoglycan binding domain
MKRLLGSTVKSYGRAMAAKRIGSEIYTMKKNKLLTLIGTALVGLGSSAWAGPHGGGGGFGGGGHFGGYSGGAHAAPAFSGGGARFSVGGPRFGGGAHFNSRSMGGLSRAPRFYYRGAGVPAVRPHEFTGSVTRSTTPFVGRTAISRQSNRVGTVAGRNRVSEPRNSTAANRQSFIRNHAFAQHDGNWHRDWNKRRAHFDHGHVFVFINGLWWGLYPWDYYPYYAYSYYPYDYYDYPYDYYDYYPSDYDDQSAYVNSDQYGNNATVSAVQSQLANLGYYRGAIDGVEGDETQAALARYQEDHDLSVTGTLTAATLQSLGLAQTAS